LDPDTDGALENLSLTFLKQTSRSPDTFCPRLPRSITRGPAMILKSSLFAVCALTIPCVCTFAQTVTVTSFGAYQGDSYAGQILASDGNFYAVSAGGTANSGVGCDDIPNNDCLYIQKITPSGTVTQLHTFERSPSDDGRTPFNANPIVEGPDSSFYGTTLQGGTGGCGTIFRLTPYGVFTVLYNFPGDNFLPGPVVVGCPNGVNPGPLTLGDDGNFYGIAEGQIQGPTSTGTLLFRVSTGGVFTVLSSGTYLTTGLPESFYGSLWNSNGSLLQGTDSNYYVITTAGVVQFNSSGSATITHPYPYTGFSTQLVFPNGNLLEGPDGSFYSTSPYTSQDVNGNAGGDGAVYKFAPSYGNIQTLYTVSGGVDGYIVNPDLTFGSDGNIYGTTYYGGTSVGCPYNINSSCGTAFQITPTGTFKSLYSFTGSPVDGERPTGPLVQDDTGSFFGTTFANYDSGTFEMTLAPALAAPVQLSFDQSTVVANAPAVLTWKVLNAFSRTMQQCHATIQGYPSGAGVWSGPQLGSFPNNTGNIYTGTTTITPTVDGTYTYALTCGGVESGFASLKVTDTLNVPASLPSAVVGVPYVMPLAEFNGTPPYTTTVTSGTPPPGLTLNPATGVLQGTPTQFGVFTLGLQVTDSATPQQTATGTTTLTVQSNLVITTSALSKGVVGSNYSQTLVASGGVPPYIWTLTSGTLPNGIKLDPVTGILSGKPTKMETQPLTLQVADSEGTPATSTVTLPLVIGPPDPIAAVEFTQAIQQYQAIGDLITSLNSTGGPPVPMIAGKPAEMRVYFAEVTAATTVTLEVSGQVNQTQTLSLQPGCLPPDQRAHNNGCPSMDFYFIPPQGTWAVVLSLNDATGSQLEQQTLSVTSRTTASIYLKGTIACDLNPLKGKLCGDPAALLSQTWMASLLMPTASVTAAATGNTVQENVHTVGPYAFDFPAWDFSIAHQAHALYTASDALSDFTSNQWTVYFAVYSHVALEDTSGMAAGAPSHGAMGPDLGHDLGVDTTAQTVAHETGHTVNLLHTNVPVPVPATTEPGCYLQAKIKSGSSTNWPYSTNNIQSSDGVLEYGFNVTTGALIDPTNTYDLMAYCVPPWISPIQYNRMITQLNGGAVAALPSPSVKLPATAEARPMPRVNPPTIVSGSYWQIGGTIDPVAGVTFDPIFAETMAGSPDAGSGTYAIQVQGAGGQVLYTRYFTPLDGEDDDATAGSVFPNPSFTEWVPVTAGAASIMVSDPNGNMLGSVPLTGAAPTVIFTSPAAGFVGLNTQTISWTIQDPDSTAFISRVLYSPDGGATWLQVSQTPATSDTVDFTQVPGSSAGLLRVYVSDGVHSGSATSAPFNVPKKLPSTIVIVTPATGYIQRASNPVYLSGGVYDADDGFLAGAALKWSDSVQGALGTGSPLTVNMNPGAHTITLTGTDSDGNAIIATTQITLGGGGPVLTLATNQVGTGCINATINAVPGSQGANLTGVNYSLDGGATYTAIPLAKLPFNLVVPGSGAVNLVATAYDASGQSAAQSAVLNLGTGCAVAAPITPAVTVTPGSSSITTAQSLSVTIGVSGGSGNPTPTGTVTLTSGSYTSSATTLASGSATITILAGSLATSTDTLTASFTPDSASSATYNSATGTNTVVVTAPAKTTPAVTVTPGSSSITTAQSLSVTIGVSGGSGNPTPTGTVTLTSGSYTSSATTLASGSATITILAGSLATSTDTLTASFTPDSASSATYNSVTGMNTVTVTAAGVQITVGTSPAGLSFSVDGTTYTSTQTLSWTASSSHTIATTSPQTNGGTQNTFASWSDGGAISQSVTAPSSAASYTATFNTSYQLTTAANPSAEGIVTPPSGTYYASGTVVPLTATPNSGYSFTSWTGSVASAGSASTTITMSAPQSVTGNFSAVVVTAPVGSLTPPSLSFTSTTSVASVAQVAMLSNTGNASLTITGITITGTNPTDFAVTTGTNACGSSLTAGSSCSIYVTFTPASAASFAATLSLADNASGSPQTTSLTGTGTAPLTPSFTVSSPTGPQTVQPGGAATYSITATAQNGTFSSPVTLAASGLPTGATATFAPTSITPGSSSATSTLTIQTSAVATATPLKNPQWPLAAPVLALIGLFFLPGKKRRRWITLALLLFASLGAFTALTACGGGFGLVRVIPPASYTITVTGTSGAEQQITTVQLTVQ
jgi:uncharacterized repeat protein (TIGR03803 family)